MGSRSLLRTWTTILFPSSSSVYLPSMIYGLVILVLLLRPGGLFARARTTAAERV